MKIIFTIFLLFLMQPENRAQSLSIFSFENIYLGEAGIQDNQALQQQNNKTNTNVWRLKVNLPVLLNERKTIIINRLYYENFSMNFNEIIYPIGRLQSIGLMVILLQEISERWDLAAVVFPKFAVNTGESFEGENITYDAAIAVNYLVNDKIKGGAGIYYAHSFGEHIFYPVVTLEWEHTPKLKTEIYIPDELGIFYYPNNDWKYGLSLKFLSNEYRMSSLEKVYSSADTFVLRYTAASIGPFAEWQVMNKFYFWGLLGYTFSHSTDVFNTPINFPLTGKVKYDTFYTLRAGFYYNY